MLHSRPLEQPKAVCFSMSEALGFLERMASRVVFQAADEYLANKRAGVSVLNDRPLHFLKHDIHANLNSTIRLARGEARIGVRATYFIMPPHAISAKYIDLPRTVDMLLEIQSLGHSIAVHVDLIESVSAGPQGFYDLLAPFLDRLRSAGIDIRWGNTHGNSLVRTATGFNGQMVFRERYMEPREPNETFRKFGGRVSLKDASARLGLDGWFDTRVYFQGEALPRDHYLLSDNFRNLALYDMARDPTSTILEAETQQWQTSGDEIDRVIDLASSATCIYLMHPQLYA